MLALLTTGMARAFQPPAVAPAYAAAALWRARGPPFCAQKSTIRCRAISSTSSGSGGGGEALSPSTPAAWLPDERISLAPMMEYTDRSLRFLLRLLSRRMVLYTEMVVSTALHYNEEMRDRSLRFNAPDEHPVVLQLGGADAAMLKEASRLALPYGYDAINLNCGCPSERVSGSGCFGAALMREPQLVAELCTAMGEGVEGQVPITVKCRIGVDDDDSYAQLAEFVRVVSKQSPVRHFVVHARKAILGGLSPEQNRKVPPLKYPYVYRLVKVSAWLVAVA